MASRIKPEFFYQGGGRSKVLSQIHHCVRFSPGIIALTGPTGSGRSLLIQSFVESFKDDQTDLCLLSEESTVLETEEELFRALADGFGLEQKPIEILEDLVDRVRHFIQVGLHAKRTMLIVIDDVRQHSDEVLEALLQLTVTIKGVSLLLSGESSLIEILKQFQLQNTLIHQIALRPLLAEESADFLRQYLLAQGVSDECLQNRKTLDKLMGKTGGNLCLLVREAQQMISTMPRQADSFYTALPTAHIVAFVAVIIFTTLAFLYYPAPNKLINDSDSLQKSPDSNMQSVNTDAPSPDLVGLPIQNTVTQRENADEILPIETPASPSHSASLSIEDALPHSSRDIPVSRELMYTDEERELLHRPDGNITLQIMSLSSEKMVKALIERSAVIDKRALSYYRRGTQDKVSYIVLYGDYPDKQKAIEAQKMLPPALNKSAPWPRPVADIQRELQRRQ